MNKGKLTVMQWPSIAPIVEVWRQGNVIERGRHISDNPEDQP